MVGKLFMHNEMDIHVEHYTKVTQSTCSGSSLITRVKVSAFRVLRYHVFGKPFRSRACLSAFPYLLSILH